MLVGAEAFQVFRPMLAQHGRDFRKLPLGMGWEQIGGFVHESLSGKRRRAFTQGRHVTPHGGLNEERGWGSGRFGGFGIAQRLLGLSQGFGT